jgi:hypothetical protein
MTNKNDLSVWTIYDKNTSDYPGVFVCRRFEVGAGYTKPCEVVATGNSLKEVRDQLPIGLTCMARSPGDDPNIVETWI